MPSPTLKQQRKKNETTRQLSYEVRASKPAQLTLTYDGDGVEVEENAAFYHLSESERIDLLYQAYIMLKSKHERRYNPYRDTALAVDEDKSESTQAGLAGKQHKQKTRIF